MKNAAEPLTFSIDPETAGPSTVPHHVRIMREGPKDLSIGIDFPDPVFMTREPEVRFGMVLIHPRGRRMIALHIHESGLWKEKWDAQSMRSAWSPDRRTLRIELQLPARYESIPEAASVGFDAFTEGRWPLMTFRDWSDAVDRLG